ncbi:UDP-N-acetylglucosamine--N-acetylmuramyl-(pentapeptide) pyrophosphoryl-undecaprenol N-acetylglucosamine transferase [Clostridiales bacterium]|nr:undecaprenyldiphospho-muramoylpentapeptide beta-N-acetylglucosaminyltransferase [Eubacterium sp.]GFI71991.1 UDP-N-acetylglucosamine--N-acetylmuramyl-(pentapeptide) pyrophosphoryl-undecaprenol N-acetylglucosamine transferase [Clostridiales bacterium]
MKILFATGGTAGHINPALAVASYIKEIHEDAEILFIGTADHMEARLVPNAGFPLKTIEISGFRRSFSPSAISHNLKTVVRLIKSSSACKKIINDFQPDVCVGFGGYVSGPVIETAANMGIPTCIHEQNAFPGITNKTLAKKADKVMVAVEDAIKHLDCKNEAYVTGLPVRGEIIAADKDFSRAELGIPKDKPLVLSFGGSLGARPLNDAMYDILVENAEKGDCCYIHSIGTNGTEFLEKFERAGFENGRKGTVEVRRYIDNMDICMAAADVVIVRAGASTLSEIEALGKASILIPSPYVAENHQYHNAMALVNRNAARILEEKNLTSESLKNLLDSLISDNMQRFEIEKNAKAMAITNARERIADIILSLVK